MNNARLNRALLEQVQLQSAVCIHTASHHTGGFASRILFNFPFIRFYQREKRTKADFASTANARNS
jgi:hypothetical protein